MRHDYQDLIDIFHKCFFEEYNTLLVRGTDEPLYLPSTETRPHNELFFAHGFFASALHECSHWLIAGVERRKQVDFGYWYLPDGRNANEQELFQKAEVKPQALECILSRAADFPFYISVDNLNGGEVDTISFQQAVDEQVKSYCEKGLPKRAETFRQALCTFYHTSPRLAFEDFTSKSY